MDGSLNAMRKRDWTAKVAAWLVQLKARPRFEKALLSLECFSNSKLKNRITSYETSEEPELK